MMISPTHLTTTLRSHPMHWYWLLALISIKLLSITPAALAQTVETSYTFKLGNTGADPVAVGTLQETDSGGDAVSYQLGSLNSDRFSVVTTSTTVDLRYIGSGDEDVTFTPSYTLNLVATHGGTNTNVQITVTVGICDRTLQIQSEIMGNISDCADVTTASLNEVIDLRELDNKGISALKNYDFAGLSSLRYLYLTTNHLSSLPENVFAGLGNLLELGIAFNQVSSLPEMVFEGLSSLTDLYLNGNQLSSLPEAVFAGLSNLRRLGLPSNQLSSLPEAVFAGLGNLERLVLTSNPGTFFPVELSAEQVMGAANRFRVRSSMAAGDTSVDWTAEGSVAGDSMGTAIIPAGGVASAEIILTATDHHTITLSNLSFDESNILGLDISLAPPLTIEQEPPVFEMTNYTFSLSENTAGPLPLGAVRASNANGSAVSYSLGGGDTALFSVGVTDGELRYVGPGEDAAVTASYTLAIRAFNSTASALFATVAVVVEITEVNTPPAFEMTNYTFSLSENTAGPLTLGTVRASDANDDTVSYRLGVGDTALFGVGVTDGELGYTGNGETSGTSYELTVIASDGIDSSSVTIVITVQAAVAGRTQMVKSVLVDVGRNITINAAAVIGGRFDVAAPHITVSGNTLNPNRMVHGLVNQWTSPWQRQWTKLSHQMDWGYWQSTGKWDGKERDVDDFGLGKRWDRQRSLMEAQWDKFRKNIVLGSSFMVPLGASNSNGDASSSLTGWTVWGKGHASGYKHVSNGLQSKGHSLSGYLGADYQVTKELLLGVAISRSKVDGHSEQAHDGTGRIDIDTTITAVWPYASLDLGTGLRIWGAFGRGSGAAEIDDGGALREIDVDMSAMLFGVKQHLLSKDSARFSLKADGFIVDTETDGVAGYVDATNSGVHRLRLSLSVDKRWKLSRTARSRFGVELGMRTDGGDSLKGQGLDLGAHLNYNDAVQGFGFSSQARVLIAHSEDYNEWGLNATVAMKPRLLGRGLSLKLTPRWGHVGTEINKLWTQGVTSLTRTNTSGHGLMPDSTKLSLSYGLGYGGMLLRPYTSLDMQRDAMAEVTLGLKLSTSKMQFSVFGNKAHEWGLNSTLRW